MTRAQRLELLKQIEKDIYVCSLESTLLDDAKSCAIHSVIEELEQEPILDKIRAEIEQLPTSTCTETHIIYIDADDFKENALAILDKYKADRSVEDGNDQ